ncbi:YeeE/YedE family protein [Aliamphritea ceti]|uniref:YeeE/YedE family protein n=1 Tax=Aliamphritea ceti TaxID=1524258 RepID=UPI0021C3D58F|nr:YeeE/YedE family protein [Aliamphritea ceti]
MTCFTEASLALFCGALFGAGLALSGMTDPANIIGFLDISGDWNPQLVFVLAAAVGTSVAGFYGLQKRSKPVFAQQFHWPDAAYIDSRLVSGAVLFGIGWGLYGYCPGPALAALVYGQSHTVIFVVSMLVGMLAFQLLPKPQAKP